MKIIEVNPSHCKRWKYADRSSFEFGDVTALAEDIKQNGQIEPAKIEAYRIARFKTGKKIKDAVNNRMRKTT